MREPRATTVGRLTKRSDFVAAASGRRFHTERMTVQGLLRDNRNDGRSPDDGLRIGLTVTKRVGHAPERNRIKRRLRTACRTVGLDYAGIRADIVVIGRRDILAADYGVLIDDLRRALRVVTKPKTARPEGRPTPSSPPNGERRGHSHAQ